MRKARRIVIAAFAIIIGTAAPMSQAGAASSRSAVAGSKPEWAQSTSKTSARSTNEQLQFRVYLRGADEAGAEAAALDISNPASPNFRHFLTSAQATARYGATAQTVATVRQWLTDSGFKVVAVPANRMYIEVTGTVDQVQRAFAVSLGTYAVKGRHLRAPDRDLTLPSAVASSVAGVVGIDQGQRLMTPAVVPPSQDGAGPAPAAAPPSGPQAQSQPSTVPPSDGFRNAPPCSAYWHEKVDTTDPAYGGGFPTPMPYAPCGYKPGQFRSAYSVDGAVAGGTRGQGVTVAIIDAFVSPTLFADAKHYAELNDPSFPLKSNQFSELIFPTNAALEPPDQCDAAGWYGEQTLDVEAVHAMAPSAKILYVGASDCNDSSLDKALNAVVDGQLAQIVSNSYGNAGEDIAPSEVKSFHKILVNAALQGIGVYFSSGDSGDEKADIGKVSADYPASDSLVTAVGGTSLGVASDGHTALETGWETAKSILNGSKYQPKAPGAFLYGSGGGTSRLYAEPSYQQGVVSDTLARKNQVGNNRGRVVPDISMDGDPNTGMLVGQTQTFPDGVYYDQYRIGGTSLSCPLFAGLMALADSQAGSPHGFINPALYGLAGSSAVIDVQHVNGAVARVDFLNAVDAADGTTTSIRTFDLQSLAIKTTAGYDNVTGLGTPNGTVFLSHI